MAENETPPVYVVHSNAQNAGEKALTAGGKSFLNWTVWFQAFDFGWDKVLNKIPFRENFAERFAEKLGFSALFAAAFAGWDAYKAYRDAKREVVVAVNPQAVIAIDPAPSQSFLDRAAAPKQFAADHAPSASHAAAVADTPPAPDHLAR